MPKFSQIPYYKEIKEKTEQHSKHKFIYEHVSEKSEDEDNYETRNIVFKFNIIITKYFSSN